MRASTVSIEFTPAERQAIKEKQRKMQAAIDRMGAAETLEEQQRIGDQLWAKHVERPRAARRIQAARRSRVVAVMLPRARAREQRPAGIRRSSSSSRTSSADPGDDDPDPPGEQTWALTFVDRAPVFWRLRAAHCRYMEWREGVDR